MATLVKSNLTLRNVDNIVQVLLEFDVKFVQFTLVVTTGYISPLGHSVLLP